MAGDVVCARGARSHRRRRDVRRADDGDCDCCDDCDDVGSVCTGRRGRSRRRCRTVGCWSATGDLRRRTADLRMCPTRWPTDATSPSCRQPNTSSSQHRHSKYTHTHTHTHPFNGPFPGLPTVECYYNSTITRFRIQTAGLAIRRQRSVFLSC